MATRNFQFYEEFKYFVCLNADEQRKNKYIWLVVQLF